jgi:hypothetical protein
MVLAKDPVLGGVILAAPHVHGGVTHALIMFMAVRNSPQCF